MKYFHSLIITGFLIPLLPLSAETVLAGESDIEFVEQREESSLTSLDEELSLLDEEFEEFREELFSLENDLQKREKLSLPNADNPLDQEKIVVFEEEYNSEIEPITLETLSPEINSQNQIPKSKVSILEKNDVQYQTTTEPRQINESEKVMTNSEFFPDIKIIEPAQELVNSPLIEKSSVKKEINSEAIKVMSDKLPIFIEKSDPDEKLTSFKMELSEEELLEDTLGISNIEETSLIRESTPLGEEDNVIIVDLQRAFSGSPIIYSLLFAMSIIAVGIWLYSILSLRYSACVSQPLIHNLQNKLNSNNFEEALSLCKEKNSLLCKMISSGIHSRRHGLPVMLEAMKAEGKRSSIAFWQKIGLLNDIAIIAPMLGLLGTVLGMFYAFYDVNRSIESISTLFDGLGISVGTTVAGLFVAILALILHSTAKYRLVRALALVENEAQNTATLIDDRTSVYKGL